MLPQLYYFCNGFACDISVSFSVSSHKDFKIFFSFICFFFSFLFLLLLLFFFFFFLDCWLVSIESLHYHNHVT